MINPPNGLFKILLLLWFDEVLIKNKNKTYQMFIKEENVWIKEQLFSRYKEQKNEITKLMRNWKKMHYNEYFC